MSASPTHGNPRGSRRAFPPLAVMAAAFFLPSYRACLDDPARSAAQFATDGVFEAFWITPVFAVAAAFAVLTALALRAGDVSRATRRLGLAALAALSATTLTFGGIVTAGQVNEWPWLAAGVASTTLAIALVRRARGRAPFQIWEHLLAAFTVLAMGTAPAIFLGGALLSGGASLAFGGYLFVLAHAALAAVVGWALLRERSARA
jgi:hypothetical protein